MTATQLEEAQQHTGVEVASVNPTLSAAGVLHHESDQNVIPVKNLQLPSQKVNQRDELLYNTFVPAPTGLRSLSQPRYAV